MAWNLRRLRTARGLSQEALGADAGVDRAYVGKLERSLENPTIGLLDRLASQLKAHISEFFVEPQKGERAPKPLSGGRKKKDDSRIKRVSTQKRA